ncbi:MAG TPA: FtsX-like permease family protein [Burkholderiales bacterium]|nr:FtsX-like permease family protein [Burkholderiales bacterium]
MTLAGISLAYLRARNLSTLLNIVLLGFGVAAITLLVLTAAQLEDRMHVDARGIDLVVGSKGSALQIILSSVYQLDVPTGAFGWTQAQQIASRPEVKQALPIVIQDNYLGFRVIGTTHDYISHYGGRLRDGALWSGPLQAVIGDEVAARTGMRVGWSLTVNHGPGHQTALAHNENPFTVVGVLWPTGTVLDHLILTDVGSIWQLHENMKTDNLVAEPRVDGGRELSALLIRYATPLAGATLPRAINAFPELQAASPTLETARLFGVMVVGMRVLRGFAIVLVIAAGLSVFIGLYTALNERRYDLAIMRALGASPGQLMLLLLFEGVLMAAVGAAFGILLGHILTSLLGFALRFQQVGITGWIWNPNELWIVAGALVVGMLAALLPAWRAHETDIARVLARG